MAVLMRCVDTSWFELKELIILLMRGTARRPLALRMSVLAMLCCNFAMAANESRTLYYISPATGLVENMYTMFSHDFDPGKLNVAAFDDVLVSGQDAAKLSSAAPNYKGLNWSESLWVLNSSAAPAYSGYRAVGQGSGVLYNWGGLSTNSIWSSRPFIPISMKLTTAWPSAVPYEYQSMSIIARNNGKSEGIAENVDPLRIGGWWGYNASSGPENTFIFDRNIFSRPVTSILMQAYIVDKNGNLRAGDGNQFAIDDFKFVYVDKPTVFLDFESDIDRRFYGRKKLFGLFGEEVLAYGPGSHAKAPVSVDARKDITEKVQAIFDRSGLDILVTNVRPEYTPEITVKFGEKLSINGVDRDTGIAYDVLPKGLFGVGGDRFNRRKDGNVAVFLSPDYGDSPLLISEIVAHEVGHGFGVPHVYSASRPNEVMDYDQSTVPVFSSVPLDGVEKPSAGGVRQNYTVNPVYHIKRYVSGESGSAIGLVPGSWDVASPTLIQMTLSVVGIDALLSKLSIGVYGKGSLSFSDAAEVSYFDLADFVDGTGLIRFFVEEGTTIDIVGSSGDPGLIDLAFIPSSSTNGDFSFTASRGIGLSGRVAIFDPVASGFSDVGSFGIEVQAVPEAARWLQLVGGLLFFAIARHLRINVIKPAGIVRSTI